MAATTTMENSCPASRVAPAWIIPSRAFTSFTTREVRDPDCSASKRWMGRRRSLEYARDRMSEITLWVKAKLRNIPAYPRAA